MAERRDPNLKDQVEDGRRNEESMTKQCQALEVEVNILKGKLEEKVKLLRFQDSTKILDNIRVIKGLLLSNLVLVFMKLLKENLVHKEVLKIQKMSMKNLKS